ncbi:MAG: acyltransferase [Croceibacterium sp.]
MFRLLSYIPRLAYCARGMIVRGMIILAGGQCGGGLRVERGLRIRQGFHPGLSLGDNVYVGRNVTIDCVRGARLTIGDNATLTEAIFISCCLEVTIGDDVLIGEFCSIRDANHDISDITLPIVCQAMVPKAVGIASNVWVGRGCAILAGATIAEGAVIGANSVVLRDVPQNVVAAGAPTRIIRNRVTT